jgi:FkbM family methyltransferase
MDNNYYTGTKYLKINKNGEDFFIENNVDDANLSFWRDVYSYWEYDTFQVFDHFLSQDKIMIDIGGWIGTTAMYGSRKSKYVYIVEADNKSVFDMSNNLKINCKNNYTIINKAIYNVDDINLKFGKNKFSNNSKMNDSSSQIYSDTDTSDEFYLTKSITINRILTEYQINPAEIGLIKVDIEGGEENILNDLFALYKSYKIPMYISFHYSWWNDKNLDRFDFLTVEAKNKIVAEPFSSLLFV